MLSVFPYQDCQVGVVRFWDFMWALRVLLRPAGPQPQASGEIEW